MARFPDPRSAGPEGIVAAGGDLDVTALLEAYALGIFPWPVEGFPLLWFSPDPRAVLDFDRLRIPRSLARARARSTWVFTIDRAFERVMRSCADAPRPGRPGTWITPGMLRAYAKLHAAGYAHSLEAWNGDRLAGGIYGVSVGGAFSAESMFYAEPNASKLALIRLVEHLRGRGLQWMDLQVLTPHMARMGARNVPREEFLARLERERATGRRLF